MDCIPKKNMYTYPSQYYYIYTPDIITTIYIHQTFRHGDKSGFNLDTKRGFSFSLSALPIRLIGHTTKIFLPVVTAPSFPSSSPLPSPLVPSLLPVTAPLLPPFQVAVHGVAGPHQG